MFQNRSRAAALACETASNAVSASPARVVIRRDTVGSEATDPEHSRLGAQHRNIRYGVPTESEPPRRVGRPMGLSGRPR